MKKLLKSFTIALSAIALLTSAQAAPKAVTRDPNAEYKLVVLHTNDHHGAVLAKDGKGGLAERATFLKQVREANNGKDFLILDAGDVNTGTAISNMFDAEPDLKAYDAMGYEAVTFGNHEFDGSLAKLQSQMAKTSFPWLSANIVTNKGYKNKNKYSKATKPSKGYLGKPYIIKNYEGYRVGIFGLTTLRTLVIASPDQSLTFKDEIETAKEMVDTLRNKEKCDIVILLGHLGDVQETETQNTSIKVAENVSGIDLIIDGHSHSYFEEAKVVNGTPIVTANEWGKYMGKADFTIKNGKVVKFDWMPVAITTEDYTPDAEVEAILKPYVDKANASLKDVVLKTTAPFEFGAKLTRYQEMASGDFLTDGMVAYLKTTGVEVDGAITNGGGIRAALPQGDVTKEAIMTMLPFENYVYVITLKGSDVVELFNFIGTIKQGAGAFAQVSKDIKYTITYDAEGNGTMSNLTIKGQPIDPNRTYRFATNDYMAKGGDGYVVFTKSIDTYNSSMLLSDVFIEYAKTIKDSVTPTTDGRITVIGGKLPE
ncbi:MAG: 5'-nucleotidase C-terminal domain-containing protein [Treponema sp.]|nr:5'-nucleotidase C-terminal domain-containing protein [Treponema sp.]